MKKFFLTYFLAFCVLVCNFPLQAFAANNDASNSSTFNEVYTDYDLGGTIERTVEDGKVVVTWKSFDETEEYTAVNENGDLFLDGELVDSKLVNLVVNIYPETSDSDILSRAATIKWGSWSNFNERIDTGGKSTAAVCIIIAAAYPQVGIVAITGVGTLITTNYSYVVMKGRIRYGSDGTYMRYERYTNVYGNGKDALFTKDFYDSGREML